MTDRTSPLTTDLRWRRVRPDEGPEVVYLERRRGDAWTVIGSTTNQWALLDLVLGHDYARWRLGLETYGSSHDPALEPPG